MLAIDTVRGDTFAVIDVRSPAEYAQGHVVGATNMPLFSNEERAAVGTVYAQVGFEESFQLGLTITGPRLAGFVHEAGKIADGRNIIVYCWRGGMRSASMAWLLASAGMNVQAMPRGYRGYRASVNALLSAPWMLQVLAGRTGSGKTQHLHELAGRGEQVLDLEGICNHKGSAFGAIGQQEQPTTEHAMNVMAGVLSNFNIKRPIWIEDESRKVGRVTIPEKLYERMQLAPITVLDTPRDERLLHLVETYGAYPVEELVAAFDRIRSKLGGHACETAIAAVRGGDLTHAADIALTYYDRTYDYAMRRRELLVTS